MGSTANLAGIDLNRVYTLYTMKGALAKDVAFSLGITVAQVRQALIVRAKLQRIGYRSKVKPEKPVKPPVKKDGRHIGVFEMYASRCAKPFSIEKDENGDYLSERTRGAWDFYVESRRKKR